MNMKLLLFAIVSFFIVSCSTFLKSSDLEFRNRIGNDSNSKCNSTINSSIIPVDSIFNF